MSVRLIDQYFQIVLSIKRSTIPKRLVRKDFSKTALHLLQRIGIYTEPAPNLVPMVCLELNKRVFPLHLFAKVIGSIQPGWKNMSFAQKKEIISKSIYKFDVFLNQQKSKSWDYFIYRDKESVKISRFFLDKNEKTVDWSSYADLNREIYMTEILQKHAVSVLPFDRVDRGLKSVTQNLIKTIPVNDNAIELLAQDLNGYYAKSRVPVNYLNEIKNLAPDLNAYPELMSYSPGSEFTEWLKTTPGCDVHGDLSENNILWNQVNYYLIDFDRSFKATIFYDYMYFWLTADQVNKTLILDNAYNMAVKFNVPHTDKSVVLKFLLYLFIVDNFRYLNQTGHDSRVSIYTQVLIKKGLSRWAEIQQ